MTIEKKSGGISGSVNVSRVMIVACCGIVGLVIFQAGILVGYDKATYSSRLGDNYFRTFDGHGGMMGGQDGNRMFVMGMDVQGGHGAVGKIVQINFPTFIVEGPDNVEKVVRVNDDTMLRYFRDDAASTSLKVDDLVVVVGSPNDKGEVEAKLIRIMPPMQSATSSVVTSQ